jgi:hypothetical protein
MGLERCRGRKRMPWVREEGVSYRWWRGWHERWRGGRERRRGGARVCTGWRRWGARVCTGWRRWGGERIFHLSPSGQEDTARGASDDLSGRWGGSHVSASGTAREEVGAVAKILV